MPQNRSNYYGLHLNVVKPGFLKKALKQLAAKKAQGEGEFRTTLENLISLASRCDLRSFENRAKTSIDRVCVFEPEAARKKA
jgi:hypothetical protein